MVVFWLNDILVSWLLASLRLSVLRPSVRMEQLGSHRTDLHEIWWLSIFRRSADKVHVSLKSDKNNRFFTWIPIYIGNNISLSSSWMRTVSNKFLENTRTHILCSITYFSKIVPFWDNLQKCCRPRLATAHMRIACCIHKATNTHSEYVILIAFPLQQCLHERPHRYFVCTLPVSIAAQNSLIDQNLIVFWLLVDWYFGIQGYCSFQRPHIIGTFIAVRGNRFSLRNLFGNIQVN